MSVNNSQQFSLYSFFLLCCNLLVLTRSVNYKKEGVSGGVNKNINKIVNTIIVVFFGANLCNCELSAIYLCFYVSIYV